ncbi:MAG: serine hydrolase [Sedimentisphaerales bacterium]|nr:serine hydrolase [Sedimentisphaerales bacterium]
MSKSSRTSMIALALLVLVGTLHAGQTEQLIGLLEARIPQLMEAEHVPGLSMALIRDNAIVWKGVFGVRTTGKPEKVDDRTVFEAASMSKPLFSYAVLKLTEQGVFDLDRPLDSYLPEPYLPDRPLAKKITGRMVMLHRTGLPNWREGGWRNAGPLPLLHEPDTRFTYSGEGYLYLQKAIERLTGKSINAWMEESLLKPLNMTDSSYLWRKSFQNNFAGGHDKEGNLKKSRRFYEQGNAAFSLYTTPTDFALFLIEIMKPDRSAGHSLTAQTVEKMTTLQVEPDTADERSRRSLGWVIAPEENGGWVCHSGSNGTGFRCNSRFSPATGSGCVIMTNADNGRKVWEAILAIIDSAPLAENPVPADPKVATWAAVQRTIKYDFRAMNPTSKTAGKIDVYVPLPLESPRQTIRYLRLSENGKQQIFTDVHGQTLAHYSFETLEAGHWVDMGFVVGITLKNMRWNANAGSAYPDAPVLTPEQQQRYLMPENNYSMETDLMRNAAAELTRDAPTEFDKLVSIHDYIISKIRYVRDNQWDPAAVVLARGTSSCSEYNYVLSGLCRLAGLPTRCVGGTTNGFRALPATDTVFHRWTEVFLSGYGWFPADCSRDANPIRGKRSHFGRVYVDAMVWCRQAGGDDDTLGWEYRAKLRVEGNDPGIKESHRTRWFLFHQRDELEEAFDWFAGDAQATPNPDLLECALLNWDSAAPENKLKMIRTLAAAGRNEAIRRAASLPEDDNLRRDCLKEICDSPDLAETALEKSRQLYQFRSWFRDNESNLVPTPDGRFELKKRAVSAQREVDNWRLWLRECLNGLSTYIGNPSLTG